MRETVKSNMKLKEWTNFLAQKLLCRYRNMSAFLTALIKNPTFIGAVAPSSKYLAEEMAAHILQSEFIVELGAGTGVITEELLKSGVNPENLIVVDRSAIMADRIRERFPTIRVIVGDAKDLNVLLANYQHHVSTIVSSLPLRILPKSKAEAIIKQIAEMLAPGGRYIQFSYGLGKKCLAFQNYFNPIGSRTIWVNLPPAQVDVWESK